MRPLALAVDPAVASLPKGSSGSATDPGGGAFDDLIASLDAGTRGATDQASPGGGALKSPTLDLPALKYPALQRVPDAAGAAVQQATVAPSLDLGPLLAKVAAPVDAGSSDPESRDRVTRDVASDGSSPASATDQVTASGITTVPPFPPVTSLETGMSPASEGATAASSVTPVTDQGVTVPTPSPIDDDVPDATWTAPTLVSDIDIASHLASSVPSVPSVVVPASIVPASVDPAPVPPAPAVPLPNPTSLVNTARATSAGVTPNPALGVPRILSGGAEPSARVGTTGALRTVLTNVFTPSVPSRPNDDAATIRASGAASAPAASAPVLTTEPLDPGPNDASAPLTPALPDDDAAAARASGAASEPAVVETVGAASSGAVGQIATPAAPVATPPGDTPAPQALASGTPLGAGDGTPRPAAGSGAASIRVGSTKSDDPAGAAEQASAPIPIAATTSTIASAPASGTPFGTERATGPSTPVTVAADTTNETVAAPRPVAPASGPTDASDSSRATVSTPDAGVATDAPTIDASAGSAALIHGVADAIVRSATPAATTVGTPAAAIPDPANPAALTPARTLTLQLNPGSLGTISVRLHLTGGALDVRLDASDPQTLGLLGRERDTLVAALRDQATTLHALTIGGGDAPPSGGHDAPYQRAAGDQASGNRSSGGAGTGQPGGQGDRPAPDRPPPGRPDALAAAAPEPGDDLFV